MLFPRFLLFAAEEGQILTAFESFLSLHFGILLAGVSAGLIIHVRTFGGTSALVTDSFHV